jgi:DNA-binding transcriptional ArsR family regulator
MAEYSKSPPDLRVERALDHPTRRAILDLLIGEKGIGPSSISEKLGVGAANASYHVDVLTACGVVEVVPDEGRRGERLIRLPQSPVENKKNWLDVSGSMRDDITSAQLKSLIETASELRPKPASGS